MDSKNLSFFKTNSLDGIRFLHTQYQETITQDPDNALVNFESYLQHIKVACHFEDTINLLDECRDGIVNGLVATEFWPESGKGYWDHGFNIECEYWGGYIIDTANKYNSAIQNLSNVLYGAQDEMAIDFIQTFHINCDFEPLKDNQGNIQCGYEVNDLENLLKITNGHKQALHHHSEYEALPDLIPDYYLYEDCTYLEDSSLIYDLGANLH